MSHGKSGNILLHLLKEAILSCLKIVLLLVGWCLKGTGHLLAKLGELTLKFAEK